MALFANLCPSVVVVAMFMAVHAPPTAAIALGQVGDFEGDMPMIAPSVEPDTADSALESDSVLIGTLASSPESPAPALRQVRAGLVHSPGSAQARSPMPNVVARAGADQVAAVPKPHVLVLLAAGLCAVVMRRETVRRGPLV